MLTKRDYKLPIRFLNPTHFLKILAGISVPQYDVAHEQWWHIEVGSLDNRFDISGIISTKSIYELSFSDPILSVNPRVMVKRASRLCT
jgi:hypothetical protein